MKRIGTQDQLRAPTHEAYLEYLRTAKSSKQRRRLLRFAHGTVTVNCGCPEKVFHKNRRKLVTAQTNKITQAIIQIEIVTPQTSDHMMRTTIERLQTNEDQIVNLN